MAIPLKVAPLENPPRIAKKEILLPYLQRHSHSSMTKINEKGAWKIHPSPQISEENDDDLLFKKKNEKINFRLSNVNCMRRFRKKDQIAYTFECVNALIPDLFNTFKYF